MTDKNGKQTKSDLAHRIGIWTVVAGMAMYVFNMGQWVGAADEKFEDAETVEAKQQAILLQVNTVATKQEAIADKQDELEDQLDETKQEILDAIAQAHAE